MLQDESLEYIKEQYDEKNMVLEQFGDRVSAVAMYEDIFNDLELIMPIVILDNDQTKKIQPMAIYDALAFSSGRNDTLMGGCSYFNNWISKKSAKEIYTFIIDYDNAYSGVLLNALQNDWKNPNGVQYAKPTYIVNSGTGLHLYFVLSEPLPCYHRILENIDKVYRALAVQQSTRVYAHRQVQWFGQDFRMAGGLNKYNWENTIFRIGKKWEIHQLARAVGDGELEFITDRLEISQKTVKKRRKKYNHNGWKSNPSFYEYALENCRNKTKEGNRYMSMCALSVIAWKCNIPHEKLEDDLISLLPIYNKGATRHMQEKEIYSAMKMYNEKAIETQRQSLENWQGWEYKPIKRNGRNREQHLERARAVQKIDYPSGEWRNKEGRPDKEFLVREHIESYPQDSPSKVAKKLGISRTTVYKYMKKKEKSDE